MTGLPGFLGHAYDMMISNTDKNEWSNYMLFGDVYSKLGLAAREEMWIWSEADKPSKMQN